MPNSNCLEGMRCPYCNSEEPFRIVVTMMVMMYDEGSDCYGSESDQEWDTHSYCQCWTCMKDGTVADFRITKED